MYSRYRVAFLTFFPLLFCSRVVFLHVFISALFLHYLHVHPYLKWSLGGNLFPLLLLFAAERGCKPTSNRTCFEKNGYSLLFTSKYIFSRHPQDIYMYTQKRSLLDYLVQIDEINKVNASWSSSQTHFIASKLVTACMHAYSPPCTLSHWRRPLAIYVCNSFRCHTKTVFNSTK